MMSALPWGEIISGKMFNANASKSFFLSNKKTCLGTVFVAYQYGFKRIYIGNHAKINRELTLAVRLIYA